MSLRRLLLLVLAAVVLCSAGYAGGRALDDFGSRSAAAGAGTGADPGTVTGAPDGAADPTTQPVSRHGAEPAPGADDAVHHGADHAADDGADGPTSGPTQRPTHEPATEPTLTAGPRLLGPGDQGDRVRDLQARLKQIYWFQADVTGLYGDVTAAAVRGFQAKREIPVTGEVDQRTLDRLTAMTSEPTDAELHNRGNTPGALDARCRTGRVVCIDKSSSTLRWVVDGTVVQTLDVRFGASTTPTREGVFSVYLKDADHVSRLYGSAMPYSMFFSGGQAVHYSSDFATVGYAGASHGCVNVRDEAGLAHLFDQVRVGDRVVVYWS